jgi:hypothetical protein
VPALVGKRRRTHPRLPRAVADVRRLVDELGKLLQLPQRGRRQQAAPHLELEARDHADQVAVPGPFPVPVHRALHVHRPGLHRRQRVGDTEPAVIMGMGSHPAGQPAHGRPGNRGDLGRKASPIRVAQNHEVSARLFRRHPRVHGIVRIQLEPVEAVLRIIDHGLPVILQVPHGVADHGEVFLGRASKHLPHVQHGGLAKDRHHRGSRLQQQPHLLVVLDRHPFAPGRAKSRQPGIPEPLLPRLLKELDVLGIGPRPATFDVVHPEGVQPLRNAKLVSHGKVDALTLRSIAEGGVVDLHLRFHERIWILDCL